MTFGSATTWTIWAQEQPPPGGGLFMFAPLVIIGLMYVFLVLRPQRREQGERQAMLANLKKNDHVLLNCGIFGVVTNIRPDADEVTLRVDESSNSKMRVTRSAIARVITDEPTAKTDGGSDAGPGGT